MEDASPFSSSLIPCTYPGCPLMGITQEPTTVTGVFVPPPQAANITAMTAMLKICFFMMSFIL